MCSSPTGKFDEDRDFPFSRGRCSHEEYSARKGCGDLLTNAYFDTAYKDSRYRRHQVFSWIVLVLFCTFQVLAVAASFYIFYIMKRRRPADITVIYNAKN